MNDERRKIKALKDDELLALFCEICEGSYPIEDGQPIQTPRCTRPYVRKY